VVLTRSMARALGEYNINVNGISPGYTVSEATQEMPGRTPEMDQMLIKDPVSAGLNSQWIWSVPLFSLLPTIRLCYRRDYKKSMVARPFAKA